MSFITPELLTSLGIAWAIGCSACGSGMASFMSGTYITRYTTTGSTAAFASSSPITKNGWYKVLIPIIISGVLAIYGFIIALLLCYKFHSFTTATPDMITGYKNLAAGISVGLSCMFSGIALSNFMADYVYYNPTNPPCIQKKRTTWMMSNTMLRGRNDDDDTTDTVEPLLSGTDESCTTETATGHSRKAHLQQAIGIKPMPEPDIHFYLVLVYLEAIGLYGFVVALALLY